MEESSGLSKPHPFAKTLIKRPCLVVLGTLLAVAISAVVDGFFFKFTPNSGRAFLLDGAKDVQRRDSINKAVDALSESATTRVLAKTQDVNRFNTQIMYETTDGSNILQDKYLADILKIENTFFESSHIDGYNSFCLATTSSAPNCARQAQVSLFRATFPQGINSSKNNVQLLNDNAHKFRLFATLENGYDKTNSSSVYRSIWKFGLPYPNASKNWSDYANRDDRYPEQRSKFDVFMRPIFEKLQFNTNLDGLRVTVANGRMRQIYFTIASLVDMYWAIASFFAVSFCISVHTGSAFLAFMSMIQILFSFPLAFLFYGPIGQVTYFDTMGTLVIFILLGIGADDVFVFTDAWVQSEWLAQNPEEGLETVDEDPETARQIIRMSFAFRRASKAMAVTQLTTFFAFLATSFSPLIPISAFGIWAALVIIMNYALVITFYPAILSLWYNNIRFCEQRCWRGTTSCLPCCKSKQEETVGSSKESPDTKLNVQPVQMSEIPEASADPPSAVTQNEPESNEKREGEERCLERVLRDNFADLIIKWRYLWLVLFVCLLGAVAFGASRIRPLSKEEQWFPPDHWITLMFSLNEKFYGGSDVVLTRLDVAWGISGIDRTGSNRWDPDDYGKTVFNPNFDLSDPRAQVHIRNVCNLIKNRTDLAKSSTCFMEQFVTHVKNKNETFPLNFSANVATRQQRFGTFMNEWLTTTNEGRSFKASGQLGYFENQNRVDYVLVSAIAPVVRFGAANDKRVVRDRWNKFLDEQNKIAPPTAQGAFQASNIAWAWMDSEVAFVQSATQGVAIATPLSFIVLLISTENIIIAFFATSCIAGIVASAMTLMVLFGWELGVTEAISIVIMIGFSVDYVVHLGNAYVECDSHDGTTNNRHNRLRFALYTMGISVVSGAVTTFVSGVFLLGATMIFFNKFGILICGTIVFSLAWSMFYFTSLLATFGPNENFGHIPFLACLRSIIHLCSTGEAKDVASLKKPPARELAASTTPSVNSTYTMPEPATVDEGEIRREI